MFRGTVEDTEEFEEQWTRDERLKEKMRPGLTIEEWHVIHTENRRRWLENSKGRTIDPIDDTSLLAKARAKGIAPDEVFTLERYLRVMNTLSSSPMFKRLKLMMDESSRKDYKKSKFGVIAGPFKTMTDVWDRLIAFEKKWEEQAVLDDAQANSPRAVEELIAKSISMLKVQQEGNKEPLRPAGSA